MEELTSTELGPSSSAPKSVQRQNQSAAVLHLSPMDIKRILIYPPPPSRGGISINTEDYGRLKADKFINDIIIDFYLKYLWLNVLTEEQKKKVYIFSSFFYTKLMMNENTPKTDQNSQSEDGNLTPAAKRHSEVKSWTKKADLFKYEHIIIPINENQHWFLAIICFPGLDGPVRMSDNSPVPDICSKKGGRSVAAGGQVKAARVSTSKKSKEEDLLYKTIPSTSKVKPNLGAIKQPCILIFDSLSTPSGKKVMNILREYLQEEWKVRHEDMPKDFSKEVFKGSMPTVPQQTNFIDCGLYLLQFAESFFKNPITDYRLPIRSIKEWFTEDMVTSKRYYIKTLIHNIMMDQNIDISALNLPKLDLSPKPKRFDDDDDKEEEKDDESMILSDNEVSSGGKVSSGLPKLDLSPKPKRFDDDDDKEEEKDDESMILSDNEVSSGQEFDSQLPSLQPSSDPPPSRRLREPKSVTISETKSKLKLPFSLENINFITYSLSTTDTTEEKDDKKSQMD